jgi:hypothetical protein
MDCLLVKASRRPQLATSSQPLGIIVPRLSSLFVDRSL